MEKEQWVITMGTIELCKNYKNMAKYKIDKDLIILNIQYKL